MSQILTTLGLMCGTSLDGIDVAVLETDGETIFNIGPAGEYPLPDALRTAVQDAIAVAKATPRGAPAPPLFDVVSRVIAETHASVVETFLSDVGLSRDAIDLIGFHGITVLHERPTPERVGRTLQLGDGARLAQRLGVDVVCDFRSADVAAGGQGAPLVPVYHKALLARAGIAGPVAVLNLGGVGNITAIDRGGEMLAFDTGPGNGLIDQWVVQHGLGDRDHDGLLAAAGTVDQHALDALFSHPYFAAKPPKSLDRYDFTLDAVLGLSPPDGAATLTAFTAHSVARAFDHLPQAPVQLIVCGGGRKNPTLMRMLRDTVPCAVTMAEDLGWRGDSLEAEAFAFLAARSVYGLPLSFPGTTGVARPQTGGVLYKA
jgi:anhydro-N-acetylmuramic acid kinase